ncbi:MAG: hypothetical protein ACOC9J_02450 [Persicimonas sp.]
MMVSSVRIAFVLAVALSLGALVGCEKKADEEPTEEAVAEPAEETPDEQQPEPGADEQKPHSSAIPGTENQLEWDQDVPEVALEITAPAQDEVLESGDEVTTEYKVTNYRTGKEIGQHVHVIVDNEPYIAHYEANEPLVLEDLEPGTHTLRVFPARHYHLALKEGDVFKTRTFHVEERSEDFDFDDSAPYITYSRPKGEYDSEAAKELLLDFYVTNVELGDDARVIYGVDGEETELTEWKPVLLPALEPGEHEITLKLVDGEGNLIENGGYNDTTRTITVTE